MSDSRARVEFLDSNTFRVGEVEFKFGFPLRDVGADRLGVMKGRQLIERYAELCRDLRPAVIVELGMLRGGSTALLNELSRPRKLVAFELREEPPPALVTYLEHRDLAEVVRPTYGIDQADRDRIGSILDEELGSALIDLVIDDASHLYDQTVSSFETVFPRLREGGMFVIEDWNFIQITSDAIEHAVVSASGTEREHLERQLEAAHAERLAVDPLADQRPPLTKLAVDLVLARSSSGDAIREVTLNAHWIVVKRGAAALDPKSFRLEDLVHDHFGFTEWARRSHRKR